MKLLLLLLLLLTCSAIAIAIAIVIVIVMASSSSLFNFVSFLLPTQITKKNPSQIISTPFSYCDSLPSLSSSTTTTNSSVWFLNRRNRYGGFVPITLYCSPYEMFVDEDEPIESRVVRFRRSVLRAGIIQEAKRRRFHENPQEKKKRKSRDAARRNRRRRTPWRGGQIEDVEALNEEDEENKDDDDNQDNWEYSEGGIPYY